MVNKLNQKVGVFFLQLAIIGILTYLASNFLGLAGTGFESQEFLDLQTFYLIGAVFAVFLSALFIYSVVIKKDDSKYGNSIGFSSLGEKPHFSFFKRFTNIQITFIFLIIFLILSIINFNLGVGQQTYTSLGVLETQQFTESQSVLYSALLIPGAENLGSALVFALLLVGLGIYARKTQMSPAVFSLSLIFLSFFLLGIFGLGNHFLRYSGQEISLLIVFVFWGIGGLLTAITGSFIPFWLLHVINNLSFDLTRFLSIDTIQIYYISLIVVLSILYLIIYRGRWFGEKTAKELNI